MSEKFKYVNGLNTIRFIAITLVVFSHWFLYYDGGGPIFNLIKVVVPMGKFGMTFFLVLSGFLISSVLFKARQDLAEGASKGRVIANFLMRRAIRLLPAYYTMIAILYITNMEYLREHIWYFLTPTSNLLLYWSQFPSPLIHIWSMAVQEQFYFILPWCILFLREKWLKYLLVVAIIVGACTKYYAIFVLHKGFAVLFYQCLDALGLGILYAYVIFFGGREKFEKVIRFMLPILLYIGWAMSTRFRGSIAGVVYERSMYAYIGLYIIIFTLNNKSALLKKYFFENKVMNYFGKISYGIYLYHYPLGAFFDDLYIQYMPGHHLPQSVTSIFLLFFVKIGLVFAVAALSYNYFETPILELKKKFTYVKGKKSDKAIPVSD